MSRSVSALWAPLYEAASPWRAVLWEAALETHRQETAVTPPTAGGGPVQICSAPSSGADLRQALTTALPSPSLLHHSSCRSVPNLLAFDGPSHFSMIMGTVLSPFLLFH